MSTTQPTERSIPSAAWIRAGAISGVLAGIAFAMFEMIMAVVLNGTGAFFMPLRMIGGIAIGPTALDPATSLVVAGGAGLVVHMIMSMMYGVVVAGVLASVGSLARSALSVAVVAMAAGFGLWIVNFFILAGAFGWNWFPDSQNVPVQFIAHTVMFGGVLGLALNRRARPRPEPRGLRLDPIAVGRRHGSPRRRP